MHTHATHTHIFLTLYYGLFAVVYFAFVPMTILDWQQVALGAILQVLCIGTVVVWTWRKLTIRGVTSGKRVRLVVFSYVLSTLLTNGVVWLVYSALD